MFSGTLLNSFLPFCLSSWMYVVAVFLYQIIAHIWGYVHHFNILFLRPDNFRSSSFLFTFNKLTHRWALLENFYFCKYIFYFIISIQFEILTIYWFTFSLWETLFSIVQILNGIFYISCIKSATDWKCF